MAEHLPSMSWVQFPAPEKRNPGRPGRVEKPTPLGSLWLSCGTIRRVGFIFTEALEGKRGMCLVPPGKMGAGGETEEGE